MPRSTKYEYRSALERIAQEDPGRLSRIMDTIKAGKEWNPDEIVDIANEEYGRSAFGLGSIIDRLSITPDITQGAYETSPESFPLSGPGIEKPRERSIFGELLGPGGLGAIFEAAGAIKGAKMGFKKRGIKGGIAGGIVGGAAPAIASLGVGAATGNVPKEVFTPATLKNIGKNILEDWTDPTKVTRRGPETFTELFPGKDRYTNFGTFMEWVSPEPALEMALGVGMKMAGKGAAKAAVPAIKAIKEKVPWRDATRVFDSESIKHGKVLAKEVESIQHKIGLDEGNFDRGMDTWTPAPGSVKVGASGVFGTMHNYMDDVVRYIEGIAGVGKGSNFLMDSIFDPAVYGVRLDTGKIGQSTGWVYRKGKASTTVDPLAKEKVIAGDPITIGGQFKFDEAQAIHDRALAEHMKKAGIGSFTEMRKGSMLKQVRDFIPYYGTKAKKSQATSELIFDAIEQDLPLDTALKARNVDGMVIGGPETIKLAKFVKKSLADRLIEMNAIRRSLGKKDIAFRASYMPHIFTWNRMDEIFNGLVNMSDEQVKVFNNTFRGVSTGAGFKQRGNFWVSPEMPFFGHALERKSTAPHSAEYSKDLWGVISKYNRGANKIIYNAIPAEIIRGRVAKLHTAEKITGPQRQYFDRWIDTALLGRADPFEKWAWEKMPRVTQTVTNLGHRLAKNILVGSASFIFNNISSLAQVTAAAGVRNTYAATKNISKDIIARKYNQMVNGNQAILQGATFSGSNVGMEFAQTYSQVYKNRQFTGYENIGRDILQDGKITNYLSKIVDSADQFNVAISFNSAYMSAVKRGVPHEQAVKFADNMAFKTQAVYSDVFKPAFLRNSLVGTVMPFQTWVNNLFQFVRKDIVGGKLAGQGMGLGKRRPEDFFEELSYADRIGVGAKLVGAAMAINGTMNALGIRSPYEVSSAVPGLEQVLNLTSSAGGYGRTNSLFIFGPLVDIIEGLGILAEGVIDDKRMEDMINDKDIREAVKGVSNFAFPGGGTQYFRWAETAYDNLMQDFTPVRTGRDKYKEAPMKGMDILRSSLFGPKGTKAYRQGKYGDTGEYRQDYDLRTLLRSPQKTPEYITQDIDRALSPGTWDFLPKVPSMPRSRRKSKTLLGLE